jgi:hypothetical protein
MHSSPTEAALVALVALMLFFLINGGIPLPRRFTIRTLLVGMTMIAVVLGIIAFAARH